MFNKCFHLKNEIVVYHCCIAGGSVAEKSNGNGSEFFPHNLPVQRGEKENQYYRQNPFFSFDLLYSTRRDRRNNSDTCRDF